MFTALPHLPSATYACARLTPYLPRLACHAAPRAHAHAPRAATCPHPVSHRRCHDLPRATARAYHACVPATTRAAAPAARCFALLTADRARITHHRHLPYGWYAATSAYRLRLAPRAFALYYRTPLLPPPPAQHLPPAAHFCVERFHCRWHGGVGDPRLPPSLLTYNMPCRCPRYTPCRGDYHLAHRHHGAPPAPPHRAPLRLPGSALPLVPPPFAPSPPRALPSAPTTCRAALPPLPASCHAMPCYLPRLFLTLPRHAFAGNRAYSPLPTPWSCSPTTGLEPNRF